MLWLYGLSITVMLVGLWGRAVTVDQPVVEEAATEAAGAAAVSDRVVDWLLEAAGDDLGSVPADVRAPLQAVLAEPAALELIERVVGDLVAAALAPPGEIVVIDLEAHLRAVLPELEAAAERIGEQEVAEVIRVGVEAARPIELETGEASPVGSGLVGAGSALRTAAVVAAVSAAGLAGAALLLASDRRRIARSLAVRTALGGLGFAAMFRLGAWALDPGGGGAAAAPSLRRAGALVLGSNLHIPLLLGLLGAGGWVILRRRRGSGPNPEPPA